MKTERHYPKTQKLQNMCVFAFFIIFYFFFFVPFDFGSKSNQSCLCYKHTHSHSHSTVHFTDWNELTDDYLWNLWSISVVKPLIFKYARDSRLSKYCTLFWKLLALCLSLICMNFHFSIVNLLHLLKWMLRVGIKLKIKKDALSHETQSKWGVRQRSKNKSK